MANLKLRITQSLTCLKKAFKWANNQSRHEPLFSNNKKIKPQTTHLITKYNKHRLIRKILEKHWHIQQIDPTLSPYILSYPAITFCKAKSIKGQLVKSEFIGSFRSDPCKRLGTFIYGGCTTCQYMNTKSDITLPNGQLFRPQHYAN